MCHETHAPRQKRPLFDHAVNAEQERLRHGEAESLDGLEIDEELELGRLHGRQVSRFFALEDTTYIEAGLPKTLGLIGTVAHQ